MPHAAGEVRRAVLSVYMYGCVYVCMYIRMYIYVHIYVCMFGVYMYVCLVCVCVYACTFLSAGEELRAGSSVCMYTYTYIS
jgi:hypothetical protein